MHLLDTGHIRFLVDCGATSLTAMKHWGVDPGSIDMIFVTHLHGDHFGGIPFFILDAQLITKRTRHLVIARPPGLKERVRDTMEVLVPGSSRVQQRFAVYFRELPDREPAKIGPIVVTPYRVVHPCGAPPYALRIECGGKVLTYSGDTEWADTLVDAASGADLFICEAYFFEKKTKYHLDYRTLMEHREELGCVRLIITHMSDDITGNIYTYGTSLYASGCSVYRSCIRNSYYFPRYNLCSEVAFLMTTETNCTDLHFSMPLSLKVVKNTGTCICCGEA